MASDVSSVDSTTSGMLMPSRPTCQLSAYGPTLIHFAVVSNASDPLSKSALPLALNCANIQRLPATGSRLRANASLPATLSGASMTATAETNVTAMSASINIQNHPPRRPKATRRTTRLSVNRAA